MEQIWVPARKPSLVISRQVCNWSPAHCRKSQAHRCNLPRFNHPAFVPNLLQDSLYSLCQGHFSEGFWLSKSRTFNYKAASVWQWKSCRSEQSSRWGNKCSEWEKLGFIKLCWSVQMWILVDLEEKNYLIGWFKLQVGGAKHLLQVTVVLTGYVSIGELMVLSHNATHNMTEMKKKVNNGRYCALILNICQGVRGKNGKKNKENNSKM